MGGVDMRKLHAHSTHMEQAIERRRMSQEAFNDNRAKMLEDLRFANLNQWPERLRLHRENDINGARPCLVLDKIGQYRRQVINDVRANMPQIRVRPSGMNSDKMTAEAINGIFRHVQDISCADIAYLTALDYAVTCGLGYFRIITEYQNNDSWDQDIAIKGIYNGPFGVDSDPHSVEMDGSDSEWCFISRNIPRKVFERLYPGAEAMDFAGEFKADQSLNDWFSEDSISIAEYFFIEEVKDDVLLLADRASMYGSRYYDLISNGMQLAPVVSSRGVKRKMCKWEKISGMEVLEETDFPSSYIPVIPVIGTQLWIEEKRCLTGLIRPAKDPQTAYNYYASVATEVGALAPRAPFIGAAGQFENFETEWSDANIENYAYLQYNPKTLEGNLVPPPQRQPFIGAPQGMLEMMQVFENSIRTSLGLYQASVGAPSNEMSGIAIRERRNEGDMGTLHFRANLANSMRHAGRIMLEMFPIVLPAKQIMQIIGEDGTPNSIILDPSIANASLKTEEGKPNLHNITIGRYEVSIDIGPAYATRRQDAAAGMTDLIKADPALLQTHADLFFREMDWPGAEKFADRSKKMLPPQLSDEDQDGRAQIPPQVRAQMQQMQEQMEQAGQMVQQLQQQLQDASQAAQDLQMKVDDKTAEIGVKDRELSIKEFSAETDRIQAYSKGRESQTKLDGHMEDRQHLEQANDGVIHAIESLSETQNKIASICEYLTEAASLVHRSASGPKRMEVIRDLKGRMTEVIISPMDSQT